MKSRKTIRQRLAELLRAQGFEVRAEDLRDARGHYRTSIYADCCRWECHQAKRPGGLGVSIDCWDTMTACVKHGIVVEQHPQDAVTHYTVSARR